MTTVRLKWSWTQAELDTALQTYDAQLVERSIDGNPPWTEITDSSTWIDLVQNQTDYWFDDTNGSESYWYRTKFLVRANPAIVSAESASFQALIGGFYATVADLRANGLPASVTDDQALELILNAEAEAERITNNYFRQVSGTFIFDGNNTYILHMPLAIVAITSLTVNDQDGALDTSYYQVWNGRQRPQDDRKNPKIVLKRSNGNNIVTAGITSDKFLAGRDQTVVGVFGYLEPDGSVPRDIKTAVMGISLYTAGQGLLYDSLLGMGGVSGVKIRERTDDHEIQWGDAGKLPGRPILPKPIFDRLMAYAAPRTMQIPAVRWSRLVVI